MVSAAEPTTPAERTFHDSRYGISFRIPAGWNLSVRDGEVSTFRLDARSATTSTRLRAVASIGFNPLPASTFSGAFFYASVTPGISAELCHNQVGLPESRVVTSSQVAGTEFNHSHDEHGGACTESRDEVYTAFRAKGCYRFDMVVNTFCGGDVSGVRDMNEREIDSVRKRLEGILATVKFDSK
jgi:hypothetical protein